VGPGRGGAQAGAASSGLDYSIDEGEGAFYGPKIDVHARDAIGREWQLSTIQVDFNLPERFDIAYAGEDGAPHRPFMIHRALFGSIERFFAVLLESTAGAFPTWLAPVQAVVVPVADRHTPTATRSSRCSRRRACGPSSTRATTRWARRSASTSSPRCPTS
jgi:threonyl-tRNA synthetase